MHNLFVVYSVNLYMSRAYPGPSSGGTTVCIQQLVLIFLDDCLLSSLDYISLLHEFDQHSVHATGATEGTFKICETNSNARLLHPLSTHMRYALYTSINRRGPRPREDTGYRPESHSLTH